MRRPMAERPTGDHSTGANLMVLSPTPDHATRGRAIDRPEVCSAKSAAAVKTAPASSDCG